MTEELLAAEAMSRHDLRGATVIPGFFDTHVHLYSTGLNLLLGVDCGAPKSIKELQEVLAQKSAQVGPEDYILGYGFEQAKLSENRYPTAKELSEAVPNKPVIISRRDGHSRALNLMALAKLAITAGEPGADLDDFGQLTGVIRGAANTKVSGLLASRLGNVDLAARAYHSAAQKALEVGLTTVHALVGGWHGETGVEWLVSNGHTLPLRVVPYEETTDQCKVKGRGLPRIGGCLLIDGSFGSHTAAVYEPYADQPSSNGVLYWEDEPLNKFVLEAHQAGLQISMHAIGDRAVDQLCRAYDAALKIGPRTDHRHRIEHFMLPTPYAMRRAAELGLVLAMQPAFEHFWGGTGGMYEARLGKNRTLKTTPLKTLLSMGCKIAGGSDCYVTPMDPLLGVHAAVNHHNENERISVGEALELFTVNGAYAAFEEDSKGTIKEGYLADMVVLASDPLSSPANQIKDIKVLHTIVGGNFAFSADTV